MRKIYKIALAVLCIVTLTVTTHAQKKFFAATADNAALSRAGTRLTFPEKFSASAVNAASLEAYLKTLPAEQGLNRSAAPVMELPMPDGKMAKFHVWKSSIMEPGLAAKYPEINTYAGQGIDDPYATVRMDYNPYFGFSAQVLSSAKGTVFIDPYARWNPDFSISYYKKDTKPGSLFICQSADAQLFQDAPSAVANRLEAGPCRGAQLITYRLALACTGEYATAVCAPSAPTTAGALAAMVTAVNRVTGVYEAELAARLVLIANTDLLIYIDGTTDPYSNNNGSTMLGQNQTNVNSIIGTTNYDIGHVFSTGGGGVAVLHSLCTTSTKAEGVTGLTNPVGDNFYIDYVAHEMGHQFNCNHTFNSVTGSCGGNRAANAAYEPGSATSIMGYAGICGSDDIQPHSDPFFHTMSFDEASTWLAGAGGCGVPTATGNTLPVITSMSNNNVNIPLSTPFTLTGAATDADGDPLTYCWEEWDLGNQGAWNNGATSTTAPLFKSRAPKTTGSRTFPDIAVILAGFPANPAATMGGLKGETLPTVGRAIKFRLTVRDNRAGGGGVVTGGEGCQAGFTGTFQVNAIAGTGPFVVSVPNGGESYPGGTSQNITWSVAGTDAAPISCTNVKISLSTDGGLTYPTVLAASTPNDGTESLTLPSVTSTTARIKVEAVGNVFFDISNANFTLTVPTTGFDFASPAAASITCAGANTSDITLGTTSQGGFNTPIVLTTTGVLPSGTSVSFAPNPVVPGNNTVVTLTGTSALPAGSYNITVSGTAGTTTHTRVLTYTVNPGTGPVIGTQPTAQTVCANSNATFTVVSATATSYLWQVSTDGGANYNSAPGTNNAATYTATAVTAGQTGSLYRVRVIGQCNTTVSNAVSLTVQTAPAITAAPQNTTLCLNSNANFSVTANGTNLTYLWQVSTDGGANYGTAPGVNNGDTYTVAGITTGQNNNRYRVVVSGTCTPPATSAAGILTVISPVAVTTNPAVFTICETGNATFTVAGNSSVPIIYKWQVSTDNGATYNDIAEGGVYSGTSTATLTLTSVTPGLNNNLYRANLSNATCTTPVASTGAKLTVNARPTVTLSATPTTVLLPGQSTTINAAIVPSAVGFNITWYKNNTLIPGITGTSYLVDSVEVGDYKVQIVNTVTGCNNESQVLAITTTGSERLFIYPSPNNGQFTIAYFNSLGGGPVQRTVHIYDDHGALVYNAAFTVQGAYTLYNVNMKGAGGGLYLVVIGDASGKRIAKGKVAIQH